MKLGKGVNELSFWWSGEITIIEICEANSFSRYKQVEAASSSGTTLSPTLRNCEVG